MKFKKLTGLALTAAMAVGMCSAAFAGEAADMANGDYTGTIHFLKEDKSGTSMCDAIFAHEADITLSDESAELTFYVAYPIPKFSDQGTDGTIKDVTVTYNGETYDAVSDIETKAVKTFDTTNTLFGINEGDALTTQAVSVELPRSAVDEFENGIKTDAFVNVFMNSTATFYAQITDLQAKDNGGEDVQTQSMEISAEVKEAVNEPSYTVTVPASVAMGTLSAEKDTAADYSVKVAASDLNGTLTVAAPEAGNLTSGKNAIAFANNFGTQTIKADTEGTDLTGTLSVKAADVKDAAAGNYTGTTTFSISYVAE